MLSGILLSTSRTEVDERGVRQASREGLFVDVGK